MVYNHNEEPELLINSVVCRSEIDFGCVIYRADEEGGELLELTSPYRASRPIFCGVLGSLGVGGAKGGSKQGHDLSLNNRSSRNYLSPSPS